MAYQRKTWQQKMHPNMTPKVEVTDKKFADIPAGATMFIATPLIVDEYIRNIPYGTVSSVKQMRKDLAAEHNAQYCCPITAGIFIRIAAEAAHEQLKTSKTIEDITPFWRILDPKSPAAKKLSFGTDFIVAQQKEENEI